MRTIKRNTGVTIFLCAFFFIASGYISFQDDWVVPDKFKNMENPYAGVEDEDEIGKDLYSVHCRSCHGKTGLGDGSKAFELESDVRDFTAKTFKSQADGVIVAEAAQFKDFEGRVRSGGTMIVESAGLKEKPVRDDIKVIPVPAIKTAVGITGSSQGANLVLLGALIEATKIINPELIEQQLEKSFAGKEKAVKSNTKAFEEGRSLVKGK